MKNSNKSQFDKDNARQTMGETWFVASFIILFAYLFVGTLEGSMQMFPNWPYFAGLALINFLICLYYGTRK
jgi:hypothetical protein